MLKNSLEEIYKSAFRLLEPLTPQKTYQILLEEAQRLGEGKASSLLLERQGLLQRVYSTSKIIHRVQPRKHGYLNTAYKQNKPQVILLKKVEEVHPELKKIKLLSDILIPLSYKKKRIGLLTILTDKKVKEAEKKLDILKLFGPFATMSIIKAQLYNEIKNALSVRDLFISMAAHELRTPTTTIQGYIQMMKKKYLKGEIPPKKWVDIIDAETIRLNSLLQELLKVEQVKTGQLKFTWRDNSLREIINRAITSFRMSHPNYKVIFENELENKKDVIYSDFDKLLQTIINLLNNAAKFSPPYSEITIKLDYNRPFFKLDITDKGKGIPKRDLPHVFEGFYKGKDNTKEGMGLGLYLAENIIQKHKGFMDIRSKVGKGTTVEINIHQ